MSANDTTTGLEHNIDEAIRHQAAAHPESLLQALGLIRWLAAAQDGSNETAQQSLNDIEDLAAETLNYL